MEVPHGKVEGGEGGGAERERAKTVDLEGWEKRVGGVQSAQAEEGETHHSY